MFTYALLRRRPYFTRYGVSAIISENGVRCEDKPWFQAEATFYGRDGRTQRALANAWGKERCERLNR